MNHKHHRWTPEEDEFVKKYYPDNGFKRTLSAFNQKFEADISQRSLEHRVYYALHIGLSEKRYKEKQLETGKNYCQKERREVGFINPNTGMIKTKDGWIRLGKLLGIPKDKYVVHLNRDLTDNRPENLAVIDKRTSMKMTVYNFWSEDSEITKSGILCCELENALSKRGMKCGIR